MNKWLFAQSCGRNLWPATSLFWAPLLRPSRLIARSSESVGSRGSDLEGAVPVGSSRLDRLDLLGRALRRLDAGLACCLLFHAKAGRDPRGVGPQQRSRREGTRTASCPRQERSLRRFPLLLSRRIGA